MLKGNEESRRVKEQWPDVYLDRNRVISVSPCTVSKEYRDMDCDLRDCAECRKEFWMKEVG